MSILRKMLIIAAVASTPVSAGFAQETEPVVELPKGGSEAELLAQLADPDTQDWEKIEKRIDDLWSRSGSVAMDLLLERGRDALEAEDLRAAIEHFTALIDHAPEFAEGYAGRAATFYRMDELGLALDDIAQVLARNPQHFESLMGLGIILEQLERPEAALRALEAASEINPHRDTIVEGLERLRPQIVGRDA